jgi:hypothetical protein
MDPPAAADVSIRSDLVVRFRAVYERWLHRQTLDAKGREKIEALVREATGLDEWPAYDDGSKNTSTPESGSDLSITTTTMSTTRLAAASHGTEFTMKYTG